MQSFALMTYASAVAFMTTEVHVLHTAHGAHAACITCGCLECTHARAACTTRSFSLHDTHTPTSLRAQLSELYTSLGEEDAAGGLLARHLLRCPGELCCRTLLCVQCRGTSLREGVASGLLARQLLR